ncbi:dedicator of cytokinesis protein 7 [Schistocerca americana]|uniref:dedicator of cytokinesis protein 7 n=1 Tax=Schistocerca americana TaxID=7009 RepID=UPI001F4FF74E|nr:dedicator of cytokinesis protein 7 [Schistocerca americana]
MACVQRAFAQKLSKQHAAEVRRQIASSSYSQDSKNQNLLSLSSASLYDVVEPMDYEEFVQLNQMLLERDPLHHVLDFPENDIEVVVIPRKIRTVDPVVPEEPSDELSPHVRDCVRCYTSDYIFVKHNYRQYSSSCSIRDRCGERLSVVQGIPHQEFEIDYEEPTTSSTPDEEVFRVESGLSSSQQSVHSVDTPRASWASFDLRSSVSDMLIPSLLERVPPETIDQLNEAKRQDNRQDGLFTLYPVQDEEEMIEKRIPAEIPNEHMGHRILVRCLQLRLELEVEPIFASIALYDAKEKKKVSENFYFDMNSEGLKHMLSSHIPYSDTSTLSRACVFDITYPSSDLFFVIKLEKVLQGDINDCAEPYIKDDKSREKLKTNAVTACERLGKYRMPFAWTAIYVMNVIDGVNSLERESGSDRENTGSYSLDRKSSSNSFDQFRKRASDMGSLTRRGSLERRSNLEKRRSWSPDDFGSNLDTFRPVTITVSNFFKQESDRLRDEDLYKFLQDLKRPCSVIKKLKSIPGTLKLDISPCPEELKNCLTPELAKLKPFPDEMSRPTKEILEFPTREVFVPHYTYRNLLYVYPKDLNFASRAGSARNIAVKVQLMCGEEERHALPVIFGKSSCPEFMSAAYTVVSYHNKCPDFYDEIKMKLPANLGSQHHLLFTFYHISCQRKIEQPVVETPIGYTWLPLSPDGRLQVGDFCLPVMVEHPPPRYSYIPPDVLLPGTKWVDNHKGIFSVVLEAVSSVHTQDKYLDRFLNLCSAIEERNIPVRYGENLESELKSSILELTHSKSEPLVKFLPVVINKLLLLMVRPPTVAGQILNVGHTSFEAMAMLVRNISVLQEGHCGPGGRHSLLTTYISYQCMLPHCADMYAENNVCPPQSPENTSHQFTVPPLRSRHLRSSSNPDMYASLTGDDEVNSLARGLDRTSSMRSGPGQENFAYISNVHQPRKLLHEELALQWVMSSGIARELAMTNSWFFSELIARSMAEYLATSRSLNTPRKIRFSEQFTDDISTLVSTITSDIISHSNRDGKVSQNLNASLAFFLFDLLSIMDRGFVFTLIKNYCKQMSSKISSLSDAACLINLKLDFLRIVCSHEHFVALNLPFGTPFTPSSAPSSPNPSISSSTSQSSFVSTLVGGDLMSFADLSPAFRQQHFLIGLVLTDLATVLELQNPNLHFKVVNLVRNLLTYHDSDPRFAEPECRARVAALYLPFLGIVMDALPQLHGFFPGARGRMLLVPGSDNMEPQNGIDHSIAMAIAGTTVFPKSVGPDNPQGQQNWKCGLSSDTTRNLLICFLWVIKNVDKTVLKHWWTELPSQRLHQLLEVLNICISCFEYKGKKAIKRFSQQSFRKTTDIKSRLEDVILGQGSARSEMIMRRKEKNPPASPGWPGDRLRWRKEQMAYRPTAEQPERPRAEVETDAHIEGNLATEVSFVILDTLEQIVQVASQTDNLQGLLGVVLKVLLHALSRNQSTIVLQNMFATQRSLVFKFPNLLFDEETEQCADLCLQLLKHCSSNMGSVRSQASASLYLLMRQNFEIGNNFARVKMQVTMSLSSLVGTSSSFSEESLRRSLKTILVYAEEDTELQETTFPEQVKDLIFNLHMILSDTVKMKEFQEDPEMLLDLMYRIAKGYQNSPDLRLTWLANMAQKHMERNNHTEAAMCLVHSAALVSEYLHMLEDLPHLPPGAVGLEGITPNVLEESAVSDDVLSPEEEGVCLGKDFTESGLVGLLEHAANSFHTAGMYEAMNDVYKILLPIAEANRDYKKLSNIHGKLHDAFTRVDQLQGKRVFGTYFRVGFYGTKFGDLNGEEFIYKEPTLTKLPEIFSRLENFYAERFGSENIVIIKDSKSVDLSSLNPEKAYIQITYVEPYFESYEMRYRVTYFDRNFNIKRFYYATPFTPRGRAHGELHEQYKRKTILTTANHFPYIKTRIQVVDRKQIILTPIEVAIEDIQKKTMELAQSTHQEPPDPKILQMVLQGCIGTTVNQGPMEIAVVFLSELLNGQKAPNKLQNKLRLCFKDFSKKCNDALKKNRNLIGADQRDYQRELERNYSCFTERLLPLITVNNAHRTSINKK